MVIITSWAFMAHFGSIWERMLVGLEGFFGGTCCSTKLEALTLTGTGVFC